VSPASDDAPEPSPFAAFAAPKQSAVEVFRERQHQASLARRRMIGFVLSCMVGAVGGATAGAAFDRDLEVVLTAVVGALAGSILGVPAGVLLGSICFGVMQMARGVGTPTLDQKPGRDSAATLRSLFFVWSVISVVLGARFGATLAMKSVNAPMPSEQWTMVAALVGGAFGIIALFAMLRFISRRSLSC